MLFRSVVTGYKIPKGLFPLQDTGQLQGSMRGPQDASFPDLNASLLQAERVVKRDPAVQNVMGFTGGGGATNTGNMFVILKPLNQRPPNSSAAQVINRLRPGLSRITTASTFLQRSLSADASL